MWFVARSSNFGAAFSTKQSPASTTSPSAPVINQQPVAATVTEFNQATLSVSASGNGSLSYQWRRNGVNIPGATSASYTTPSLTLANNLDKYQVVVSSAAGASVTSQEVTLSVAPATLNHLVISEISSCYAVNIQCWLELHNPTGTAINLSDFRLKISNTGQ